MHEWLDRILYTCPLVLISFDNRSHCFAAHRYVENFDKSDAITCLNIVRHCCSSWRRFHQLNVEWRRRQTCKKIKTPTETEKSPHMDEMRRQALRPSSSLFLSTFDIFSNPTLFDGWSMVATFYKTQNCPLTWAWTPFCVRRLVQSFTLLSPFFTNNQSFRVFPALSWLPWSTAFAKIKSSRLWLASK